MVRVERTSKMITKTPKWVSHYNLAHISTEHLIHTEATTFIPAILSGNFLSCLLRDIIVSACPISLFLHISSCSYIPVLSIV